MVQKHVPHFTDKIVDIQASFCYRVDSWTGDSIQAPTPAVCPSSNEHYHLPLQDPSSYPKFYFNNFLLIHHNLFCLPSALFFL